MVSKKKLYKLKPTDQREINLKIQQTKRNVRTITVDAQSNQRVVREILANRLSGNHIGLWLLVPEYLRMGAWDLIKGCFGEYCDESINARMGLQLVNESALCATRIREKNALCNQGFSLANGLSFLATDESIHNLLDQQRVDQYKNTQVALARIRKLAGHYHKEALLVIDPHRIISSSKRIMAKKKKRPGEPSQKMLQTFFCNDANTGQPVAFIIGSSGQTCSAASIQLVDIIPKAGFDKVLILADKEHFTREILELIACRKDIDILMPAPNIPKVTERFAMLDYHRKWPGYWLGESTYRLKESDSTLRLIVQRNGEIYDQYTYSAFLTTSDQPAEKLLPQDFPKRWSVEEFFNFEGDMGWNRASTFNLNVRYGKQTMALIAQAASYQLKKKLPPPFKQWTARHTAEQIFLSMDGDVRVNGDTIIVTLYNDYQKLGIEKHYQNLPNILRKEGVDPRIPWLYNYKLDFRFK